MLALAIRFQRQLTQETTTIQLAGTANISNPLTTAGAFVSKTTSMTYHASGLRKSFTYPANAGSGTGTGDGATIRYTYDSNGQLKTMTLPNGRVIAYDSYRWTAPTQRSVPNAVTNMDYDPLQRPSRIQTRAHNATNANGVLLPNATLGTSANPQGATYLDYRYQFNDVSNILKRQTEHGDYQYGYDDLDRLTQVVPPAVVANTG